MRTCLILLCGVFFSLIARTANSQEINVGMKVVGTQNQSDGMSDAEFNTYNSIVSINIGSNYVVEVWIRDVGSIVNGIAGGDIDILYDNTAIVDATGYTENNTDFTVDDGDASIDDAAGMISNLGLGSLSADVATSEWVRLGFVDFSAIDVGTVTFNFDETVDGFAQSDGTPLSWDTDVAFLGTPYSLLQIVETFTWDGEGANSLWSTSANWVQDQNPYADVALVFTGTGQTTTNDIDAIFNSVTFDANAGAFTLSAATGHDLSLAASGYITNQSSNLQTINAPITANGDLDINAETEGIAIENGIELPDGTDAMLTVDVGDEHSENTTIAGSISGVDAKLVKEGAGTLKLDGVNDYSGQTTVSGGKLIANVTGALPNGGDVVIANAGSALQLNADQTINTLSTDSDTSVVLGSNQLTINGDSNSTITGQIDGTNGLLSKSGVGALELAGANTLGSLEVAGGLVTVTNGNALTGISAVDLTGTGARLNLSGVDLAIGSLSGISGTTVDLGDGNVLTISGSGEATFSGEITNVDGDLVYTGSGTQVLAGVNTYQGDTTVDSTATGTLSIIGSVAGDVYLENGEEATNPTLLLGNNAMAGENATLYIQGSNLGAAVASAIIDSDVDVNISNSFAVTGINALTLQGDVDLNSSDISINVDSIGQVTTLSGVIKNGTGDDTASLEKTGNGQLNLTGDNTLTGGVTLTQGTLGLGHEDAVGDAGALTIAGGTVTALNDGGALDATVQVTGDFAVAGDNDSTLGSSVNLNGNTRQITATGSGVTTLQNVTNGGITKLESGTITLAGDNDLDNGLTINDGEVNLKDTDALEIDNALTINDGGQANLIDEDDQTTFTLDIDTLNLNTGGVLNLNGNTLEISPGEDAVTTTLNGQIIGAGGSMVFNDAGSTWTLTNGTNSYSGTTVLDEGTVSLGAAGALGASTIEADGGTLATSTVDLTIANAIDLKQDLNLGGANDFTLSGVITSTTNDGLVKNDNNTITLSGTSNTYDGTTTINAGTLAVSNGSAIADDGFIDLVGGTFQVGADGETIGSLSGADETDIQLDGTLTISDPDNEGIASDITGNGGLTKQGANQLRLSGTNDYLGLTTISNGTLQISGGDAIGDGNNNGDVQIANGAFLHLFDAGETIGDLTGQGTVDINGQAFVFGDDASNAEFAGSISDATLNDGSVTFQGTNGATLSGDSTFQGDLNVNASTLNVTGTLDTTSISINNGATFQLSHAGGSTLVSDANIEVNNGTFDVDTDQTIADLDQTANGTTALAGNLTISGDDESTSNIAGTLNGTGELKITGQTRVDLTGANESTGTTSVEGTSFDDFSIYNLQGTSQGDLDIDQYGIVNLTGTVGTQEDDDSTVTVKADGWLTTDVVDSATEHIVTDSQIYGDLVIEDDGIITVDVQVTMDGDNRVYSNDVYNVSGNATIGEDAIIKVNDVGQVKILTDDYFDFLYFDSEQDTQASVYDTVNIQESLSDVSFELTDDGNGVMRLTATEVENLIWTGTAGNGLLSTNNNWENGQGIADAGSLVSVEENQYWDLDGKGFIFSDTNDGQAADANGVITIDDGVSAGINAYSGLSSIEFDSDTAESMTLTGDVDFLFHTGTTGIVNNSTFGHTIDVQITTGSSDMTIDSNDGDLTFTKTINNAGGIIFAGGTGTTTTITDSGTITGDGGVEVNTDGTIQFDNANDYTGGTKLTMGNFEINNNGALGSGGLTLNGGTLSGSATTISNATTIGGDVTLDADAAFAFTGTVDLGTPDEGEETATHTLTTLSDAVFSNVLIGANNLIKDGDGKLTLSGENDHTGDITVNDGNLTLTGNAAMGNAALLTVNNADVDHTGSMTLGADETIGALAGNGNVDLTTFELTLAGDQTADFSGVITNEAGSLTYAGSGYQELSGANDYTGNTTVDSTATGTLAITGSVAGSMVLEDGQGTLLLGNNSLTGTDTTLTIQGGNLGASESGANIDNDVELEGTLTVVGTTGLEISGDVNLNDAQRTINVTEQTQATNISGVINNGSLLIDGSGNLELSGNNTFTGGTTLTNGTLTLGSDTALGLGTGAEDDPDLVINGGTLASDDDLRSVVAEVTINSDFAIASGNALELTGTMDLGGTDRTVTVNNTTTFGSDLDNGDMTVGGSGTLKLTGSNNFDNGLTVDGATVELNSTTAMHTGDSLTVDSGMAEVNSTLEIAGLSGDGGTLKLDAGLTFGTNDDVDRSLASQITGTGLLTKTGTDTQTFTADNSGFTGGITVNGGTIAAGNNNAFGDAENSTVTLAAGTTLASALDNVGVANDMTLTGNANVQADTDLDLILSGNITGDFKLTKTGAGILQLDGASNIASLDLSNGDLYLNNTGGNALADDVAVSITGNSSTLQLFTDETIGSLAGTVGTLSLQDNILTTGGNDASTEFAGNITGTSGTDGVSLIKEGDGDFTLSGANTFAGDVNLTGGELTLAGGSALADTVTINQSTGTTLELTSNEDIGALDGTGTVNLNSNTLGLNATIDTTYAGVIEGDGTIDYDSVGTMRLTGLNTNTGTLNVNNGTIYLANMGQTYAGGIIVNDANLYGIGSTGSSLTLNNLSQLFVGHAQGSDDAGTFTVGTNATLNAGSNSIFRISYGTAGDDNDTTNDAQQDRFLVNGHLTVLTDSGLTYSVTDENDQAVEGDRFSLFIVEGDLLLNDDDVATTDTDDLTVFDVDGPALIDEHFEVVKEDGTTYINLVLDNLLNFQEATLDSVNPGIGAALVKVAGAADGGNQAAKDLVAALEDLTDEQLDDFVKQVNDSANGSTVSSQNVTQLVQTFNQVLSNHLAARRSDMPVYAQRDTRSQTSMLAGLTDDPHTLAQVAADETPNEPEGMKSIPMNQWAAFGKIYGIFSDQDTTSDRTGYSSDGVGVQFGMDYQINGNWIVGLAFDYAQTDITLDAGLGSTDVDTFRIGPFLSYFNDQWYVDANLTYGFHNNDATRIDTVTGTHDADYDAYDLSMYLGGGYKFKLDENWTLTPTASLRYTYYNREAYTESGTGALSYGEYDTNSLHSRLGVKLTYRMETASMILIPEAVLGWEHEYLNDNDATSAAFTGGSAFTVNTGNPDDNSVFFGTGLTAVIDDRWSAFVRYEGNVSGDGETHAITGGIRIDF